MSETTAEAVARLTAERDQAREECGFVKGIKAHIDEEMRGFIQRALNAEAALAHAKAEALRDLARVCFDEGDAGVVVGGIEIVETYVYDTIAALTGDEKDRANAELMREIVAGVKR